MKSKILQLIIAIICANSMPCTGTVVILTKLGNRLVVGADGKLRLAGFDRKTGKFVTITTDLCKIQIGPTLFAAFSGTIRYPTGRNERGYVFDAYAMLATAARRIQGRGVFSEFKKAVLASPLKNMLTEYKTLFPKEFESNLLGGQIFDAFVFGIERGQVFADETRFTYESADKPLKTVSSLCPGECSDNTTSIQLTEIGARRAIREYLSVHPGFLREIDQEQAVRILINYSATVYPDTIGPPISILELSPTAKRWIEQGACPDIDTGISSPSNHATQRGKK